MRASLLLLAPFFACCAAQCASVSSSVRDCEPTSNLAPNLFKQPVRLNWDSWATSQLATMVAAILLKEQLGLEVELVPGSGQGAAEVYEAVATGAVHAAFEMWPGGKEDYFRRFASFDKCSGRGARAFNTSITARSGIFEACSRDPTIKLRRCISADIIDSPPTLDAVLATARGLAHFASPGASGAAAVQKQCVDGLFACDANGVWTPSHCVGQNCSAKILHIAPDYDKGLVEGFVSDLRLPVTVVYMGREGHHDAFWEAYTKRSGALFYYYSPSIPPHGIPIEHLPRAEVRPASDFPRSVLQKLAWAGLEDEDNFGLDVIAFVESFALGTVDYAELAATYDFAQDVHVSACTWVKNNRAKWEPWISLPQRQATKFDWWNTCVFRGNGHSILCHGGCTVLAFVQPIMCALLGLLSCCWRPKRRRTAEELKPAVASIIADVRNHDSSQAVLHVAKSKMEVVEAMISPEYAKRNAFLEAHRSPPIAIQHVRTLSGFCQSNVDPAMQRPPNYAAARADTSATRTAMILYFFCSGAMLKMFVQCFCFALLSSSLGTIFWIMLKYEAYHVDPHAFSEGAHATQIGTFGHSFSSSASAFNSVTSSFKFFPSFLMLGYVGFTVNRWRSFLNLGYSIQGRIHDVSLMVGGGIVDPSDMKCRQLAFNVYRYLVLVHILLYKEKTPWLQALSMDDFVVLGLLTDAEKQFIMASKNKMRDTGLAMLSAEIQLGLNHGLIHTSCTVTCLDQLARLRGKMAAYHDMFTVNQPNVFASLMFVVVDMLVYLFIVGSSYTMFVFELGCFQHYVFVFAAFLTLPWICCMDMINVVRDPYSSYADMFNVDSLMGSSEQVAFHNLRVRFDFPVKEAQ